MRVWIGALLLPLCTSCLSIAEDWQEFQTSMGVTLTENATLQAEINSDYETKLDAALASFSSGAITETELAEMRAKASESRVAELEEAFKGLGAASEENLEALKADVSARIADAKETAAMVAGKVKEGPIGWMELLIGLSGAGVLGNMARNRNMPGTRRIPPPTPPTA